MPKSRGVMQIGGGKTRVVCKDAVSFFAGPDGGHARREPDQRSMPFILRRINGPAHSAGHRAHPDHRRTDTR